MADERDPKASRRYRELGGEEPPAALDDAILAASRRAVAPRRRWYIPLAAAAVAVLAVGVALQVRREPPDTEAVTAPAQVKEAPAEAKRRSDESGRGLRDSRLEEKPSAPAAAPQAEEQNGTRQFADQAPARVMQEGPEPWLGRIAQMRGEGRHEEADKALAEFRQRYPDYRIPPQMLEKIERK
jgi:hypothetical protein